MHDLPHELQATPHIFYDPPVLYCSSLLLFQLFTTSSYGKIEFPVQLMSAVAT